MSDELQPWQWEEPVWRRHVGQVRAGRGLEGPWPENAQVAVAISFDPDHETIPLREGETGPGKLSQGESGRVASRDFCRSSNVTRCRRRSSCPQSPHYCTLTRRVCT